MCGRRTRGTATSGSFSGLELGGTRPIFPPQVGSASVSRRPSVSQGPRLLPHAFFKEVPRPRVGTKARPDTGLLSQCRRHLNEHRGQSRATGDCGRGSPQKFVAQLCFRETCWGRSRTASPGCGGQVLAAQLRAALLA